MKSARELHTKNEERLERESNDSQYNIAKECMDEYHVALKRADYESKLNLQYELGEVKQNIELMRKLKRTLREQGKKTKDIRDLDGELKGKLERYLAKKKSLQEDIKKTKKKIRKGDGIELIINKYNGTTDVILPVRDEDLGKEGETLIEKLYQSVSNSLDDIGTGDESYFEGYKVLSVDREYSRKEVAGAILHNLPQEFAGMKGAVIYVRMAPGFSFSYEKTEEKKKQKRIEKKKERKEAKPARKMKSNGREDSKLPTEDAPVRTQTLSKEEAIELFEQGLTCPEIRERHPAMQGPKEKMRLAGWNTH